MDQFAGERFSWTLEHELRKISLEALEAGELLKAITAAVGTFIREEIEGTALRLACNLGYETFYDPGAEDWCAGDDDVRHAVRVPLSYAAVMDDYCKRLGMELPELIAGALNEPTAA